MNAAAVAADLSAGFFMYRRVGYDERVMHLLLEGKSVRVAQPARSAGASGWVMAAPCW